MALGTLAKSSSFSVATKNKRTDDPLYQFKTYLYVEPEIELDFIKCLDAIQPGEIVFLCGSSGDGKSEILTRHLSKYEDKCRFHLDATHSFSPRETAIDALNKLFDDQNRDQTPLVIGINIGMLANFAKEGDDRHSELRDALERFLLTGNRTDGRFHFLDFEAYPKFRFDGGLSKAPFIKMVLNRISRLDEQNPFYNLLLDVEKTNNDPLLASNFRLLARESVQQSIITNLFKVRLRKNQFITTRALLDFIHDLLLSDGYLFDTLFTSNRSELSRKLNEFDPALLHTQMLDQFVLKYELGLSEPQLNEYLQELKTTLGISLSASNGQRKAASLLRLFYVLQGESVANDFHRLFATDFEEHILTNYAHVWTSHSQYQGTNGDKSTLRNFYVKEFIPAIVTYANRKAPGVSKRELFLGKFGSTLITAPIELKHDLSSVESCSDENVSHFSAFIKLNGNSLRRIEVNLNLFELVQKLNQGYCPNKYDKNAVLLLDDVCEQLADFARDNDKLKFYDGTDVYQLLEEDGMISVEGDI